jgi:hypothetical protein
MYKPSAYPKLNAQNKALLIAFQSLFSRLPVAIQSLAGHPWFM